MNVRELPIRAHKVREVDRSTGPGRGAADLGNTEFEPVRQVDAHAVLGAGHRVADRLTDRLNNAGHPEPPPPRLDVHLKLDGSYRAARVCAAPLPNRPTTLSPCRPSLGRSRSLAGRRAAPRRRARQ